MIVHWPVPGTMRTRATASLRRPVAAAGAMVAGRSGASADGALSELYAMPCSSVSKVSSTSVVSATVFLTQTFSANDYWEIWVISKGTACWAWCGCVGPE